MYKFVFNKWPAQGLIQSKLKTWDLPVASRIFMEALCSLQWELSRERPSCSRCLSKPARPSAEPVMGPSPQQSVWTSAAASSLSPAPTVASPTSGQKGSCAHLVSQITLSLRSELHHGCHLPESPRGPILSSTPHTPVSSSPIAISLTPSPTALASWLVLTHTRHAPTSGPLHWPFPLPEMFFPPGPHISRCLLRCYLLHESVILNTLCPHSLYLFSS